MTSMTAGSQILARDVIECIARASVGMEIYLRRHDLILSPSWFFRGISNKISAAGPRANSVAGECRRESPCIQTYDAVKRRGL